MERWVVESGFGGASRSRGLGGSWRRVALPAVVAWAALACAWVGTSSARANDQEFRMSVPIWLTLQGGMMFPAGDEGSELKRGGQLLGSLGYQLNPGFVLEGDLGFASSGDIGRTRIVMIGLHGRLNPNQYLRPLYVVGGAAFYDVTYHPNLPGIVPPPDKIRPGMSFGIGYDLLERSRLSFGIVGAYHGIVIARSDALSYVTLGLYASLRPSVL
jgi:hypothetical protein